MKRVLAEGMCLHEHAAKRLPLRTELQMPKVTVSDARMRCQAIRQKRQLDLLVFAASRGHLMALVDMRWMLNSGPPKSFSYWEIFFLIRERRFFRPLTSNEG